MFVNHHPYFVQFKKGDYSQLFALIRWSCFWGLKSFRELTNGFLSNYTTRWYRDRTAAYAVSPDGSSAVYDHVTISLTVQRKCNISLTQGTGVRIELQILVPVWGTHFCGTLTATKMWTYSIKNLFISMCVKKPLWWKKWRWGEKRKKSSNVQQPKR